MFSSVDLSLNIQNNVNYPVQINVLGNPYNLLDTSNATTEYRWDFTSFTFTNQNQIIIQYKLNSETSFTTYSGQLGNQTLQAIVDVLNNLNIGYFNLYTQGLNTYIGTYNDNYTFGQMNVFSSLGSVNPNFFIGTGFDLPVRVIQVQTDGKIICGGDFSSYNGVSQNAISRLNPDGSLDTTFNSGGSGFNGEVYSLELQTDGKIICGGRFTSYNGVASIRIIRLNTDGSIDATFTSPIPNDTVNAISIQTDGKIIIGGAFTQIGGLGRLRIARLNSNGSLDNTFVVGSGANSSVLSINIQTDGNIIICGNFSSYKGVSRNRIVRVDSTNTIDATFVIGTGFDVTLFASLLQPDGKILCTGNFTTYNGSSAPGIVRLNTNGSIDTSFVIGSGIGVGGRGDSLGYINGFILLGGLFFSYQGNTCGSIVAINSDGSFYSSLGSGANNEVNAINTQTAGSFLAGGSFTTFDNETYNCIVSVLF